MIYAAALFVWALLGAIICGIAVRAFDFEGPRENPFTFWLAGVVWPIGALVLIAIVLCRIVEGVYRLVAGELE